jgi:hypothetical protein
MGTSISPEILERKAESRTGDSGHVAGRRIRGAGEQVGPAHRESCLQKGPLPASKKPRGLHKTTHNAKWLEGQCKVEKKRVVSEQWAMNGETQINNIQDDLIPEVVSREATASG